MPTSQFGIMTPSYGLRKAKIGSWNGDGTYGNLTNVPSVQMLGITQKVQSGELEGNDDITDTHGRSLKATARFRFGSVSLEVLRVLTGQDLVESGSTPNRLQKMFFRAVSFPYFGIIGLSQSTNSRGALVVFAAKCKVVSDFGVVELEFGKYSIPDLTVDIISDDFFENEETDQVWNLFLDIPTSGTFTLSFAGATTTDIAYTATATDIQNALEALLTVEEDSLIVTAGTDFVITAAGNLAGTALTGLLTADFTDLVGAAGATLTETTPGVDPTPTQYAVYKFETSPVVLTLPPVF